jgi:hypothetical protein
MKKITLLITALMSLTLSAQQVPTDTKEVKTSVDAVTVFNNGAQITRKKTVLLPKGVTQLRFTDLSPYISAESITVKATTGVTILSVNHKINFLDQAKAAPELEQLKKDIEAAVRERETELTRLEVIKENIDLLQKNKDLSGKNNPVQLGNLQQVADYYNRRLTELKLEENKRNETLDALDKRLRNLQNQKTTLEGKTNTERGEISIKVSADAAKNVPFELRYVVDNAHWQPSYDLRASDINQPIRLVYKASVQQDTKEDWNNVHLTLSSAEPTLSNEAPELNPYYIDYGVNRPSFKNKKIDTPLRSLSGMIQGIITDEQGEPLPGVYVVVKGTTNGVSTDFDGKFSISTNVVGNNNLEISYIGFKTQVVRPKPVMRIALKEDNMQLEEVVVSGYTGSKKRSRKERDLAREVAKAEKVVEEQPTVALKTIDTPTNVQFNIEVPYTIKSDNQVYAVDIQSLKVPTQYKYYTVPAAEKAAFLMAQLTDYRAYNLLEGEANIFYEDTFIGKTSIDPNQLSDTLKISLGQDKKVVVNREAVKQLTSRQMLGSKEESTRHWKTTVRNAKSEPIHITVLDQLPVSRRKEIEVINKNVSGGKLNPDTGEITWELTLQPSEKKELEVEYSVKYPKNRRVMIE